MLPYNRIVLIRAFYTRLLICISLLTPLFAWFHDSSPCGQPGLHSPGATPEAEHYKDYYPTYGVIPDVL